MNIEYKGHNITIEPDEDPQNPRTEWDNVGTMVCFHRHYNLGDKHEYRHKDYSGWAAMEAAIWKKENAAVVLPLYLYDHSGITMACVPFDCPWDSGQVGFIFVSKAKAVSEWGKKVCTKAVIAKAEAYLRSEVEDYDQYLQGDIWCYSIEGPACDDSCCGMYGHDYCETEAKAAVDAALEGVSHGS